MEPIIVTQDLKKVYRLGKVDVPALRGVDLTVREGELVTIFGPNGSGKTTLLLTLAALLKPASGTISYFGRTFANGSDTLKLRRRQAVVFQEPLLLSTTVWSNVTLGLRLRGVGGAETETRARKWLERFGIAGLANRQAKTLSGGEAKRVSLARAFVLQPEVLFLDEPFTGLDSPTRQALIADFEGVLRETKVTTVIVTHDSNEALALAHRVAVLMHGQIRQTGSPEEVFSYPVDEEVAGFVEVGNVLHGVVETQSGGLAAVSIGDRRVDVVSGLASGTNVTLLVRQEDVTISLPSKQGAATSARNHFSAGVDRAMPAGYQMRVTLDCGFPLVVLVTRRSWEELGLKAGSQVVASFKASSVHLMERG